MPEPNEKIDVPQGQGAEPAGTEIEFVKKYLKENRDNPIIKDVIKEIAPINKDVVSGWAETDEGSKFFQAFSDKRVTQALKTYEEGHFAEKVKAEVESKIRLMNPGETEEQKRLRSLELQFEEEQKKRKHAEMKSITVEYANQKNLNLGELLEIFVSPSEEETRIKIDKFGDYIALREQQAVNKVLATNSRIPQGGDKPEDLMFSSPEEIQRFVAGHPEKYEQYRDQILRSLESFNKKR